MFGLVYRASLLRLVHLGSLWSLLKAAPGSGARRSGMLLLRLRYVGRWVRLCGTKALLHRDELVV